jgi:hypothetical protein
LLHVQLAQEFETVIQEKFVLEVSPSCACSDGNLVEEFANPSLDTDFFRLERIVISESTSSTVQVGHGCTVIFLDLQVTVRSDNAAHELVDNVGCKGLISQNIVDTRRHLSAELSVGFIGESFRDHNVE